jgi:RNA polymerase sigma factor (sigma-70 family)
LADALDGALDLLTPDQRTILILRHHAGLSNGETARVLGIPSGTAGSRLHYATQALRSAIEMGGPGWPHDA